MTTFTVFAASRVEPSGFKGAVLQRDDWNDFSFKTQYHLYLDVPEFSGRIGAVKILRRGQTDANPLQLKLGNLQPLSEEWISLGQDLDYYERLAELPTQLRADLLLHLRDALAYPKHALSFFDEVGWAKSVLRSIEWESFKRDAAVVLERDYDRIAQLHLKLEFQMAGWRDPLMLDFEAPTALVFSQNMAHKLPDRLAVIVGRNGSGKSTLLSRLARILHASQHDRSSKKLSVLGEIIPKGVGFTRVINIAYSAFDAFQIPGVDYRERKQIVEDLKKGTGRYHYCGLRDIVAEVGRSEGAGDIDGQPIASVGTDRQETVLFKTSEKLNSEFERTIARILEIGRKELFSEVCDILASDTSFLEYGEHLAKEVLERPVDLFRLWSTGHKIVMHAIATLVAFTEPKSIVLIDEPESHLHPPLLAAMMHAVRLILRRHDAFAVVATHSPVVVQETLRRHTAVVRRIGKETSISKPRIETYGESIGEITNEIFGLSVNTTDFHTTLSSLIDQDLSFEEIEDLFENGLSLQARAFVLSEMAQRDN